MKIRKWIWFLSSLPGFVVAFQSAAQPSAGSVPLREKVRQYISQPAFDSAVWGIHVISLSDGGTLVEHHPGKLIKPASVAKLFTAAMAMDRLGSTYQIETSIHASQPVNEQGIVGGDLVIFGRGDPSFSSAFLEGEGVELVEPIAAAVAAAGIRQVKGDLIADTRYFQGPPYGTGWSWRDLQYGYGAPASALSVSGNTIRLLCAPGKRVGDPCRISRQPEVSLLKVNNRTRTEKAALGTNLDFHRRPGENSVYLYGSMGLEASRERIEVSVAHPSRLFARLVRRALEKRGIQVHGSNRIKRWKPGASPVFKLKDAKIGEMKSPPLEELAKVMLKRSDNLIAQLLLLHVGAGSGFAEGSGTTEEAALRELETFTAKVGISEGNVLLQEGAGLSHHSLVTPSAVTTLLRYTRQQPYGQTLTGALPIAGKDGTLAERFTDLPSAVKVRAKTGTMKRVHALAGYITSAGSDSLAFAVILNHYQEPETGPSGREAIDGVVRLLAGIDLEADRR
jgi:D-alanyl-D-alanine carboxypeptidase/D-alanyl-D-alanine-endopeptidase (penicillin-binding protein 4)